MSTATLVAGTTCVLATATDLDSFFVDDCRHLSRLALRISGPPLRVLSGSAEVVTCAPATARDVDPPFLLVRRRTVRPGGLTESLELTSFAATSQTLDVGYEVAADFADQFELRSSRTFDKSDAVREVEVAGDKLIFSYARRGFTRTTTVHAEPAARLSPSGPEWTVDLPPHGTATVEVVVSAR